jgi:2-methylisocitrate lyase-like PEP mutase family enzyme
VSSQAEKGEAFRALHEGDPFVIPNPWDQGSAKMFASLGFRALATTSSGLAFTLGRRDRTVTLAEMADHVRALDRATGLPVSADLEDGYGSDPEHAAATITVAAEAGAVGGSIEDRDPAGRQYEPAHAAERVAAAVEAARTLPFPFTLTARAENRIEGDRDLEDTIARLQAYEQAGADVLYAPGLRDTGAIAALTAAVGRPVNALARPGLTMQGLVAAGAQRVSVGGALAWVGAAAVAQAATRIRDTGDFDALASDARVADWLDG